MQKLHNDLYRVYDHSTGEWKVQMFIASTETGNLHRKAGKGVQLLVAEHGDSGSSGYKHYLTVRDLGNGNLRVVDLDTGEHKTLMYHHRMK